MNYIKLFEKFTEQTLKINNDTYNDYYNSNKKRSNMVAWDEPRSQIKNFTMVSKFINKDDSILYYGCGIGDFIKYLEKNKNISDYLGVDINDNFINRAKKDYPNNNFQVIKNVNDIRGKWDSVCAIGVFTWFITKDDFIKTINKLYEICNKQVLITCLYDYYVSDTPEYWESKYRAYNANLLKSLFPNFNMEFIHHNKENTMLIKINKKV